MLCVIDVSSIVADYLADSRGPIPDDPEHRKRPDSGIVAKLTDRVLEIELTFRSGSAYCCYEWGCHVALRDGQRWDGLRRQLAAHNIAAPPRMELRLTCVIEEGAIFFDFAKPDPKRRGWYAFAPVAARCYQVTAIEAAKALPRTPSPNQ
jgi:hypothetical protein